MILLIDMGNSRTKYCSIDEQNYNQLTKMRVVDNNNFINVFFNDIASNSDLEKVIISNVGANLLVEQLIKWCKISQVAFISVKSEASKNGVISGYTRPQQLGVDRWLTLLAVAKIFPRENVLIIDAGTATTIDLIAATGQHHGGWILAGVSSLFNSLLEDTTHVVAEQKDSLPLTFGNDTTSNVNSACWAATVGFINQAITQANVVLNTLDKIVITGGNAAALQKLVTKEMILIDDLILCGLSSYH